MTRTRALQKLLEHGSLTWAELREITSWPNSSLWWTVRKLEEAGVARRYNVDQQCRIGLA